MKKHEREIYLNLTNAIHTNLCSVCKYSKSDSYGCCEGYNYCAHPVERICDLHDEPPYPGDDCWAFRDDPRYPVALLIDIVSSVLLQGYDKWGLRWYSPDAVTVYGRIYDKDNPNKTSKVRIGHNGKEDSPAPDPALAIESLEPEILQGFHFNV